LHERRKAQVSEMKTILRKVSTGQYFQSPGRWTNNPAEAFDFKMIDRALQFIAHWNLKEVELAFAFSDRQEVKRVPLEKIALQFSEH